MRSLFCSVLVATTILPLIGQEPFLAARAQTDRSTKLAWSRFATLSATTLKQAAAGSAEVPKDMLALPELTFAQFFGPIGPRGMEYSNAIRGLSGQRIRLRGFMVQQNERVPGLFLFAAMPVKVDTRADCNETDTPPAMLHVFVPGASKVVPWVPGPHFLSGVLELGARHESDDRISVARLTLDPAARDALFGPASDPAPVTAR